MEVAEAKDAAHSPALVAHNPALHHAAFPLTSDAHSVEVPVMAVEDAGEGNNLTATCE